MTKQEMIDKLTSKMQVSAKEAETALEFSDWDLLDAAMLLERERGGARAAYSTERAEAPKAAPEEAPREKRWKVVLKKLGAALRKLLEYGNRNRFEVRRKGEEIVEAPVTVLAVLLLVAFWITVPLLVVGLFTGCRYSFSGPDLGKEFVNSAMDRAARAAEQVKEDVAAGD